MIACPNCGWSNNEGARFCENCGADLRALSAPPSDAKPAEPPPSRPAGDALSPPPPLVFPGERATSSVDPSPTSPEWRMAPLPSEPPPPKKRRTWLWILLGFIGALVLCCCAAGVWASTDSGERFFGDIGTWAAEQATEGAE